LAFNWSPPPAFRGTITTDGQAISLTWYLGYLKSPFQMRVQQRKANIETKKKRANELEAILKKQQQAGQQKKEDDEEGEEEALEDDDQEGEEEEEDKEEGGGGGTRRKKKKGKKAKKGQKVKEAKNKEPNEESCDVLLDVTAVEKEIGELKKDITKMTKELKAYVERGMKEESEKRRAQEIEMLPYLILNKNLIIWEDGGEPEAFAAIKRMTAPPSGAEQLQTGVEQATATSTRPTQQGSNIDTITLDIAPSPTTTTSSAPKRPPVSRKGKERITEQWKGNDDEKEMCDHKDEDEDDDAFQQGVQASQKAVGKAGRHSMILVEGGDVTVGLK
ncbi:hypothetical protein HK102_013964, partial [Quaeritorhiza haematococci]